MSRLLLSVTFGLLLALALGCAGVAWLGAAQATQHLNRARLAHDVLAEHRRLAHWMDIMLRDAALAADPARPLTFDASAARNRLREQFAETRRRVAAEIALLPADSAQRDELEQVAQLEVHAFAVVERLDQSLRAMRGGAEEEQELLAATLAEGFGTGFRTLLARLAEAERSEAEHATDRAEAAMRRAARLAGLAASAALVVAAGAPFLLFRRQTRPLEELAAVARAAAAGDLSRRVDATQAGDEFAHVARDFNVMIAELARGQAALRSSRDALEAAVAARTAELAAANATLRRSDDARRRFLADVSHELRTPLTVIRGEAEIALRGGAKDGADYRQTLGRVAEEAAHTARLVDDLLFVARSEAGEARAAVQAVAFAELVRGGVAAARTLGAERRVTVLERLAVEDAVVQGDPNRLRQLVLILLDNAVRYSDPGGTVTVTLVSTPAGVQLSVADQGMGISADDLERVFERFYRGDGAATRHAGGTGLGLPLARAIALAHDGAITLDSRLGEGTTARVVLPVVRRLRVVA
jgi:signal transduction histidine kinase